MPRQVLEIALHIGIFHEAEAQFDANDAAAIPVAGENGDAVAVFVDVGDLRMSHLDKDQVARKHAVALPQQRDEGGCTIAWIAELVWRHDKSVALKKFCGR